MRIIVYMLCLQNGLIQCHLISKDKFLHNVKIIRL